MRTLVWGSRPKFIVRLRALGLFPPQAMALLELDPERPMAMSALAERLHCDNSNITGIADRLEAAGLVERRPAENDRRVKTLSVTPRGVEVRATVREIMAEPPPGLDALDAEDLEALRAILERALQAGRRPDAG
jgi:MarR family transcriptional regulator, organic hydroperoxide resistance regulator